MIFIIQFSLAVLPAQVWFKVMDSHITLLLFLISAIISKRFSLPFHCCVHCIGGGVAARGFGCVSMAAFSAGMDKLMENKD